MWINSANSSDTWGKYYKRFLKRQDYRKVAGVTEATVAEESAPLAETQAPPVDVPPVQEEAETLIAETIQETENLAAQVQYVPYRGYTTRNPPHLQTTNTEEQ